MPWINIANDVNTKHIHVDVIEGHVSMSGEDFCLYMDSYDARELGRMLKHAGERVYKEREERDYDLPHCDPD